VFNQILSLLLVWLATFLSNLEKIASNDFVTVGRRRLSKKVIGWCLIVITTVALGWQLVQFACQEAKLNKLISDSNTILFSEASGGAAFGRFAYIVDDEKPIIFKLSFQDGRYVFVGQISLAEDKGILSEDDIDDLEAASMSNQDNGKTLYILTSHSNTKHGKENAARQRLLKVSLEDSKEGQVTQSRSDLRPLILKEFENNSIDPYQNKGTGKKEIMHIEGLAIDKDGYAYLGFRAPLVNKRALVLRARLTDFFSSKEPKFETFQLTLNHNNRDYGIVSIDYDARTKTMLVLGNDPDGSVFFEPVVWQWNVETAHANEVQNPRECCVVSYEAASVSSARPELLLLPPKSVSDRIYTFLDTDRKSAGGEIFVDRRNCGLKDTDLK
jgi:hypothetical protein